MDDKSKTHVGETDPPVSTGVRGRESITPKLVTLKVLDHDMHNLLLLLMLHFSVIYKHQLVNLSLEEMFITLTVIASFSRYHSFIAELCYVKSLENSNTFCQS